MHQSKHPFAKGSGIKCARSVKNLQNFDCMNEKNACLAASGRFNLLHISFKTIIKADKGRYSAYGMEYFSVVLLIADGHTQSV